MLAPLCTAWKPCSAMHPQTRDGARELSSLPDVAGPKKGLNEFQFNIMAVLFVDHLLRKHTPMQLTTFWSRDRNEIFTLASSSWAMGASVRVRACGSSRTGCDASSACRGFPPAY